MRKSLSNFLFNSFKEKNDDQTVFARNKPSRSAKRLSTRPVSVVGMIENLGFLHHDSNQGLPIPVCGSRRRMGRFFNLSRANSVTDKTSAKTEISKPR